MNGMSSTPNAKKKWLSYAGPNKMGQMGWPSLTCPATLKLFFSIFLKKIFFCVFFLN
jgi:hypothetical protein